MAPGKRLAGRAAEERRPHFFKVLLGDFAQRLKIPPNFCKHIPWEASRKAKSSKEASMAATLEGPSGRTWLVVIRRTSEGTFFTSGWPRFVQDHALRELEFLVFRYDGDTRFTVLVFDRTACQREDLFHPERHRTVKPAKKHGRPAAVSCKRHFTALESRIVKNEAVGKELMQLPFNAPDHQLQLPRSDWAPNIGGLVPPSELSAVKTEIETDELPLCAIPAPSKRERCTGAGTTGSPAKGCVAKRKTTGDELALASVPPSVRRYKGYVSRRRPVTGEERQRAMEMAYTFRSSSPYFVIRMSTMHVYYSFMLRFPTAFSKVHLPRKRTDMVLRDPSGRAWVVAYIPHERDRLSRGWCAFARGNCLEEGDYCAFELVGAVEFRVHIFRVVGEAVPAVRMPRT